VSFVGVDGEGVTDAFGQHRYVLFGVGEDQIEDPEGLDWRDVFEFLYRHYKPATAFVGFFLGYDFTQIIKTLPEDRARILLTKEGRDKRKHRIPGKPPHPVEFDGWQFDVLTMKRLRIRPKRCQCEYATCDCKGKAPWMYVCDVGSFFQTAFVNVIDPKGWNAGTEVVTTEEFATIKAGKEKRASATLDDEMRLYNRLENVVLSRVMATLDKGFHEIGIHLSASKWFGPGQAASAWLEKIGAPKRKDLEDVVPRRFREAAKAAYFGGWFELFAHGHIPGTSHEYDINSAYPTIIASLPCLQHGEYSFGNGLPGEIGEKDLVLVYANVWSPGMPDTNAAKPQCVGSMLHREDDGSISRPYATEGWYWWHELQAAVKAGMVKPQFNRGNGLQRIHRWVKYVPCDCPPPMREIAGLYIKRLEVGKNSPLGKAAKLVYNSAYGKFAQSVGTPLFGNAVYASLITAGCRKQILEAIETHPKGRSDVVMVATDAVYFLNRHPGLRVTPALGDWDYKERFNLTLFKPGVYWDDETRERIAAGNGAHFKARGFKASDFIGSIARVDREFDGWRDKPPESYSFGVYRNWPIVEFPTAFTMTTALQALMRNDWSMAGKVETGVVLKQDSVPSSKRDGIRLYDYEGRQLWRSQPLYGIGWEGTKAIWSKSAPYKESFGMDDPFSYESREVMGVQQDGNTLDLIRWVLSGE
jgi:hypothetical protein